MNFADQLTTHRHRLRLSQAELAAALGVSARAVWQWENGRPPKPLTQAGILAKLETMEPETADKP